MVPLTDVRIDLVAQPTVNIVLPHDYKNNFISDAKGRQALQSRMDPSWLKARIEDILQKGRGAIATPQHPMRSFGAGILSRVSAPGLGDKPVIVLNIRGSNRGCVWPLGVAMPDLLGWKEFAGVTGAPDELLDPRFTAVKELYEEVAFVSKGQLLLPDDVGSYEDTQEQLDIAVKRAKKHLGFALSPISGSYPAVRPDDLRGDPCTTVQITDGQETNSFSAVVNYDPATNALEVSFVADVNFQQRLTGIISLAGPENDDLNLHPYLEDVLLVAEAELRQARLGQYVSVRHLVSKHGPANLKKSPKVLLRFSPTATLMPLVSYLDGTYSFRNVLAAARSRL
jgi:hypothetical protein